jgi:hypothetical protein
MATASECSRTNEHATPHRAAPRARDGGRHARVSGCAVGPTVVRVAKGHVQEGRFVSVEAYAAFFRGALADDIVHFFLR